jgi:undecaprenyl diphosphate synthase
VSSATAPEGAAGLGGGSKVPRHVAIIMDGNGRWASKRGLPRVAGHKAGAEAVRRAMQSAVDHGVEVLTLYAFSSENWRRSAEEVGDLTALMRFYLEREFATLQKEEVRLKLIGDYSAFGPELVSRLERAVERTANNRRLTLVVALNYGSRAEITAAAKASSGGDRRAGDCRRAPDARPAGARLADPHVRRNPALEFPPVAGGLRRANIRRHFVAGLQGRRFRAGS